MVQTKHKNQSKKSEKPDFQPTKMSIIVATLAVICLVVIALIIALS